MDTAFKVWMSKVDAALIKKCGMAHDDLPDVAYRDEFDGGTTPEEMAAIAYENALEG